MGKVARAFVGTFLTQGLPKRLALSTSGSTPPATMKPASAAVDFSFDFQDLLLRPVGAR